MAKGTCDCCGATDVELRKGTVTGIETDACAVCHGYAVDEFDEPPDTSEPCTQASVDAGCRCGWSSVNSASIDPPHEVINKNCPLHGNAAARDPDAAYEAMRDDPPPPFWEEDF